MMAFSRFTGNSEEGKSSRGAGRWADAVWVLAMAAQGGLMVALPVLIGLGVGFWLDSRLGTLPWISLLMTLIGGTVGPLMLYRWVTSSVKQRMAEREDKEKFE